MNVLARAWRVYADPATSEAVAGIRWMIPIDFAAWLYRLFAPADWPALSSTTLLQVCLWYALLWFVRERDAARAELKRTSLT